jgi:diguanylate cyclase (GGDEF) domain
MRSNLGLNASPAASCTLESMHLPQPPSSAPVAPVARATFYRLIYPARVLGMALSGLAVGSVLFEQHAAAWLWGLLVFTFLLWPHLAFAHARFSPDAYAAEKRNLLLDSMFVGMWIPLMHFNLLVSAVLAIITTFDKVYTLIRRLWLYALIGLIATAALESLLLRPTVLLTSTTLVELCTLPLLFIYTWVNTYRGARLMRTTVRQNWQLAELRRTDGQTGLYAREHWQERATAALQSLHAEGKQTDLLLIDIDHFKHINDTWGHTVGDEVISAVGQVIRACVRSEDHAGRYGGDEFAIVISHATIDVAPAIAERIRAQIEALRFANAPQLRITSSIGLTRAQPQHANLLNWINDADAALYRAKHLGRNQIAETMTADA